jgi:cell division protein FtsA
VRAFGEDEPVDVSRYDLAHIIAARVEEIFSLMMQEIKRSGYDGLLPAGVVLTGGSSQLPGIRRLASEVMGLPVRVARPENLVGMVDQLHSPAFSTSIGLLEWAARMHAVDPGAAVPKRAPVPGRGLNWQRFLDVIKRLFP